MPRSPFTLAYKALAVLLLGYVCVAGLLLTLPKVGALGQSSRSVFFHLPMWFAMYVMMLVSLVYSVLYLRKGRFELDIRARESAAVGIAFGVFGLLTGMVWSRVSWGEALPDTDPAAWWMWDPKQTLALASVLIYVAYLVLRSSVEEPTRRARIAGVYNVIACACLFPLTYIIPRQLQSLHPGTQGSDTTFAPDYRLVLYPAFAGFILLAFWVWELRCRRAALAHRLRIVSAS